MKITVVGSGFVGQTAAMRLLEKGLGEVCLIDIIEGKPEGIALDLKQAAAIEGYEPTIVGTNDYADTAGSDLVVITAGFPRQPGMSRMDLLGKNAAIMRDVIANVVPGSPDTIVIVVSNPLDEMTFLAAEASGLPRERVFGMAGVLDSARLRSFIAEELGVSPSARRGDDARLARGRDDRAAAARDRERDPAARAGRRGDAPASVPAHARRRRGDRGAAEGRLGLLRAERVGGRDGLGDHPRHEGRAAGLRMDVGAVRDLGRLRRRAGEARPRRRRGDRRARPERRRARGAARGRGGDPRQVRGLARSSSL